MTRKVKYRKSDAVRPLGMHRGSVKVSDDFDSPLPAEIIAHFLEGLETPKAKPPEKPTESKRRRTR
jgi:hypothetical protein